MKKLFAIALLLVLSVGTGFTLDAGPPGSGIEMVIPVTEMPVLDVVFEQTSSATEMEVPEMIAPALKIHSTDVIRNNDFRWRQTDNLFITRSFERTSRYTYYRYFLPDKEG